ncbi:MAG: LEPR-XLL domain-containing protein, partial [Burkholderiaceae bacterium]
MKRAKPVRRKTLLDGFRRSRTSVERLEDRLLLSADPLVKVRASDAEPLAVENLAYTKNAKPDALQGMETLSSIATLIDLTRPVSQQNTKLNWAGSSASLLNLNSALESLVLDLGDGDSRTALSQDIDGRLRLTREEGDDLYDLVFAKPTRTLGIRGAGGLDRLLLNSVALGSTQLDVQVEQIELKKGSLLTGDSGVELIARNEFSGDIGLAVIGAPSRDFKASIDIAGSIQVKGDVVLTAEVVVDLDQSVNLLAAYTLKGATESRVSVLDGASITAKSLSVNAFTDARWVLAANDGVVGGRLALDLKQDTRAVIEGGVNLALAPGLAADGQAGNGLVVQAVDWLDVSVTLDMAKGAINGLSQGEGPDGPLQGFELGWTQIDLARSTTASLGKSGLGSRLSTVSGQSDETAGQVYVTASSFDGRGDEDGDDPGIHGTVMSNLVGLHINKVTHDVRASLSNTKLDATSISVSAISEATHSATGKIAKNNGSGSTEAWVDSIEVDVAGALQTIALDQSIYEAISEGFSADIPKLDSLKVGIASASNTVNRLISARVQNSNVRADELYVIADSNGSLSVALESMAVFEA